MNVQLSTVKFLAGASILSTTCALMSAGASAEVVALQEGTATFSQTIGGGPFTPSQSVDGNFGALNGWAIARYDGFGGTNEETAVWETATDVSPGRYVFRLYFAPANNDHLLGRFRFSVTRDNRSTFADGLDSNGDVGAAWVILEPSAVLIPSGMTYTVLPDQSVLVAGGTSEFGVYQIEYDVPVLSVTGVRLEAMEHNSLPGGNGPGLFPRNGNFQIRELTLEVTNAVPEPRTHSLMLVGISVLMAMTAVVRRRH